MKAVLVTAPTLYPITLAELMMALRIDDDTLYEFDRLNGNIKEATESIEDITRRKLLTQTWDYYLDRFPAGNSFKLPFGNLATVTHIKYTDSDGTQTTMTVTTDYLVETNGEQCGKIVLPYGETWPSFTAYPSNPIVVRFVCGWTSVELIPYTIKAAVLLKAVDMYLLNAEENKAIMDLLSSNRLWDEF